MQSNQHLRQHEGHSSAHHRCPCSLCHSSSSKWTGRWKVQQHHHCCRFIFDNRCSRSRSHVFSALPANLALQRLQCQQVHQHLQQLLDYQLIQPIGMRFQLRSMHQGRIVFYRFCHIGSDSYYNCFQCWWSSHSHLFSTLRLWSCPVVEKRAGHPTMQLRLLRLPQKVWLYSDILRF